MPFAPARRPHRADFVATPLALKLLLPRVYLIAMCLVALRQVGHRHLLLQRLQSDLRPPSRIDLPSRLAHGPPRPSMTERLALQLIRLSQIPIPFSVILARLVATLSRSEEHTYK